MLRFFFYPLTHKNCLKGEMDMVRRANKQNPSILKAVLGGLLIALAVTVGVAVITAVLVAGEKIEMEQAGYASGLALLLGAFFGALSAAGRAGQKRMIVCLVLGTAYLVVLLCVTALFFDAKYAGVGVSALLILGASGTAGLLGLSNGSGKRRRKLRI